ncbi:YegP family protein [Pseudoxanthomonas indica]|uniref:DUF1508 domain-containing protein n=1 Tax=Pseudoxanthomonas indica TaxID=428993 RepID=A0A1T5K0E6_9GAMM|nr:DUF1508 domain-containing protein [Pseudoxanthomonas indica]GGD45627.1 hypothetical protein GCM10007235_16930 [Pseudoxanthomonas indica]SKC56949.1 hypothetical protein SAMN06296058_1233 [Pseudoxanthomonas indica]
MAEIPKQFALYKDRTGEWRWRLHAANGKIIADSAEAYTTKANCIHGARLVASVATGAGIWNVVDQKWEA